MRFGVDEWLPRGAASNGGWQANMRQARRHNFCGAIADINRQIYQSSNYLWHPQGQASLVPSERSAQRWLNAHTRRRRAGTAARIPASVPMAPPLTAAPHYEAVARTRRVGCGPHKRTDTSASAGAGAGLVDGRAYRRACTCACTCNVLTAEWLACGGAVDDDGPSFA